MKIFLNIYFSKNVNPSKFRTNSKKKRPYFKKGALFIFVSKLVFKKFIEIELSLLDIVF